MFTLGYKRTPVKVRNVYCLPRSKERNKRCIRNRMVYNDWGLYSFVQMLAYKCPRFGKQLSIIDERNTSKACRSGSGHIAVKNYGLVMDRDETHAVYISQPLVPRLRPLRSLPHL